jgi:hypothetical protein
MQDAHWLGVSDSASNEIQGLTMFDHDLLVGKALPLVDLGTQLGVGGEDGLVGTELGNCGSALIRFAKFQQHKKNRGEKQTKSEL